MVPQFFCSFVLLFFCCLFCCLEIFLSRCAKNKKEEEKCIFSLFFFCSFLNCKRKNQQQRVCVSPFFYYVSKEPKTSSLFKEKGACFPLVLRMSLLVLPSSLSSSSASFKLRQSHSALNLVCSLLLPFNPHIVVKPNQTKPLHPKKNPETLPFLLVSASPF